MATLKFGPDIILKWRASIGVLLAPFYIFQFLSFHASRLRA